MAHPRDEIVVFEAFEEEIRKLGSLLADLGIDIPEGSDLHELTLNSFKTLYYSLFADERPEMTSTQTLEHGAALAGLGDLACKINRARAAGGFEPIKAHLANMVMGSVRMNASSVVTDQAANKNSELFVGCLALGAGMLVELEDPVENAAGRNPDVLLERADRKWSIAVKASHAAKSPTIFGNIKKGVEQIERSGREGVVFVNLKNVVDHAALARSSPFLNTTAASQAVLDQVRTIVDRLHVEIVEQDWLDLLSDKRARPLVVFMAQITVSAAVTGKGTMFTPVKVMLARTFPPAPQNFEDLVGLDAGAWRLIHDLNEELQRNPPS